MSESEKEIFDYNEIYKGDMGKDEKYYENRFPYIKNTRNITTNSNDEKSFSIIISINLDNKLKKEFVVEKRHKIIYEDNDKAYLDLYNTEERELPPNMIF